MVFVLVSCAMIQTQFATLNQHLTTNCIFVQTSRLCKAFAKGICFSLCRFHLDYDKYLFRLKSNDERNT